MQRARRRDANTGRCYQDGTTCPYSHTYPYARTYPHAHPYAYTHAYTHAHAYTRPRRTAIRRYPGDAQR